VSFSAITGGDLELARGSLRELNVIASSLRETAAKSPISLEEAMLRLEGHEEGPVLLLEPSDAIESGAPGENVELLRALVEGSIEDAGVIVNDAEAVLSLRGAQPGELRETVIGGKSGGIGAEPLALEVELVSKSDGRFVPESDRSQLARVLGDPVEMGPCTVVRAGGVLVLLTSRRTPPFDLAQWRSQGVEPGDLFAIGVKAAAGHRLAYDPIATASYVLDLPGPCSEDLRSLPFENVTRPVYPLDDL
jgi:microcystin degradation protein MlrC